MTRAPAPATAFDPAFVATISRIFEQKTSFNRALGLAVTSIAPSRAACRLAMRPEFVGPPGSARLHGGVISASLDAIAGLAVMAEIAARHADEPVPQRLARFVHVGTIDLHVDFLRPATGVQFEARAEVVQMGARVASIRMEFLASDGALLATGTASYIVA